MHPINQNREFECLSQLIKIELCSQQKYIRFVLPVQVER